MGFEVVKYKDQHWVPRSYLEAWTDPNPPPNYDDFVHLFDRRGGDHRTKSPKNIMSMPDLYTIFDGDSRDLRIENAFGRWESEFVRVRKKIESLVDLNDNDIAVIYVFVGALMARPPHKIEFFRNQWENILKKARSIRIDPNVKPMPSLSKGRPSISLDEAQEFIDNPMGTWFPENLAANIEVLSEKFGFDIFINESEHPFLTSDAPAVIYHPPLDKRFRNMPRGLGSIGCEITLPISPQIALLFRHKEAGLHAYLRANWETVFDMNFRTITKADAKIVSDRHDLFFVKTILDLVAKVDGNLSDQD